MLCCESPVLPIDIVTADIASFPGHVVGDFSDCLA